MACSDVICIQACGLFNISLGRVQCNNNNSFAGEKKKKSFTPQEASSFVFFYSSLSRAAAKLSLSVFGLIALLQNYLKKNNTKIVFFCVAEYTEASVHILALDGERLHQSISRLPAKKNPSNKSFYSCA